MDADKLMERIEKVEPGGFDAKWDEMQQIVERSSGILEVFCNAFRYGFLKGQREAKAAARKQALEKRRKELETDAPGYGLLTCLIERNRRNEAFINVMTAHAKNLEKLTAGTKE